jgi:hypothetical protein
MSFRIGNEQISAFSGYCGFQAESVPGLKFHAPLQTREQCPCASQIFQVQRIVPCSPHLYSLKNSRPLRAFPQGLKHFLLQIDPNYFALLSPTGATMARPKYPLPLPTSTPSSRQ